MHHLWHASQTHNACTAYLVHALLAHGDAKKYRLWTDLIVMFFVVCFFFSSPKQIGGDDQWIGCCHDGRKAWAGVHGGSGEDTQSKWVHKEKGLNWCLLHVCSRALSFCSSQWQHKQQSGALVVLWSSGSGGNDTRTDLLPEEIFWSTASSVVWLNKKVPLCPPLFSPTPRHVFIRWKWDSILSKPPHLIGSRIFLFSCYRWVPFKKEIKAHILK